MAEVAWAKATEQGFFAAVEGQVVEVAPLSAKGSTRRAEELQAEMLIEPAPAEWSVLLGLVDTPP